MKIQISEDEIKDLLKNHLTDLYSGWFTEHTRVKGVDLDYDEDLSEVICEVELEKVEVEEPSQQKHITSVPSEDEYGEEW